MRKAVILLSIKVRHRCLDGAMDAAVLILAGHSARSFLDDSSNVLTGRQSIVDSTTYHFHFQRGCNHFDTSYNTTATLSSSDAPAMKRLSSLAADTISL